ncbi:MAG: hypothetical protein HY343_07990 [Lentisphaerae bacterium]|nr:hypothetical protein [Lentisphaerota bacterium]
MDSSGQLDLLHDEPPGVHGYGVDTICLFLRLVMQGVSLRGAARVLALMSEAFGWSIDIPDWTTGRLWLMRVGHAMLTMPLEKADDWAWLIDHSVQIGQEKCLVILGIRLRDLPPPGECMRHHDLRLIALLPRVSWTRPEVAAVLEDAVGRTGVPRVIVNDHGVDLHGGVEIFQQRHPSTKEVYDIKHKTACLLKHRLEKHPRWKEFQHRVGQTRCAVQQTEMAFLVPPAPKPKARFMNLQPQLEWADGVLDIVDKPPATVLQWVTAERLRDKLGWLSDFTDAVSEWSEWQQVMNVAVEYVDRQGISRAAARGLCGQLPRPFAHASTDALAKELVCFVAAQGKQTRRGERFPGSTEVLESCFGKMKVLEKQQSRGGFTSLVVSFGAILANTTSQAIQAALQHSDTKAVYQWCKEHLGTTLFGKRKLAFAESATKDG